MTFRINIQQMIRQGLALCAGLLSLGLHAKLLDDSIRWPTLKKEHFGNARVVESTRVKVIAPASAEDALNVPIGIKIEGLANVQEVRVLVDYNPIVKAVEYFPKATAPNLAFRLKLQQTSPVRALARTADGVWHMGLAVVEAAGGGCTAPSLGSATADWRATLNQVQSKVFDSPQSTAPLRLRFRVQHPMDTGLAPGIPALFLERLSVQDGANRELMRIHAFEPISENPVFSLDLMPGQSYAALKLVGVDNQGNKVNAKLQ